MAQIRIGIVEDEAIIADTIAATLNKLGYESLEPCGSFTEAIQLIENDAPDLLLVDIQLAGKKTGIDLGKMLHDEFKIPFIYLTSNSDQNTLDQAKHTHPDAFLVKPFNKDDLFTAIEIALFKHDESNDKVQASISKRVQDSIFIKEDGNLVKISLADIKYVMSDHVYLEIHTSQKRHIIRSKMEDLLKRLPLDLLQVHRRYVVNLKKVSAIGTNHLMIDDIEIPVSKAHKEELMNSINRI